MSSPPLEHAPPPPPPPRSGARLFAGLARALRITIALALILLSLWSVLLPVSVPISTVAAVTARVASVPAPIQGDVVALAADTGDRIGLGALLAEIKNERAYADLHLAQLRGQRADLDTQLAALADELREAESLAAQYEARTRDYAERIVRETEGLVVESTRTLESLMAAKALAQTECELLAVRRERASRREDQAEVFGLPPDADETLLLLLDADLARARRELELADKAIAVEAARGDRLRAHVADAKGGYYVALGVETPRYVALLEDLGVRATKLRTDKGRVEGLAANLDEEIANTERRLLAASQRRVASPVSGVVWNRLANVGQFTEAGAELYRVADQKTIHVQAYFHRRYLDGLAIGDKASVYLVAARKVVPGTVKVIQAIDAGAGREEFAIDLPAPDEDHFKVLIELDVGERKAAEIGGVAKVVALGALEGPFERAMMWLYLRFES
jgi:multidrug resistance efflux pump